MEFTLERVSRSPERSEGEGPDMLGAYQQSDLSSTWSPLPYSIGQRDSCMVGAELAPARYLKGRQLQ